MLFLLLQLAQSWRALLSKNRLLTQMFVHFNTVKRTELLGHDSRKCIYNYVEPVCSNEIRQEIENFRFKPLISIIMAVYDVDPKWLKLAIGSINKQWYENWELCIVDDNSHCQATLDLLFALSDPKIKIKFFQENKNISAASNKALSMATGEYVALMDHDDEITPDALFQVVKAINGSDAEFIYSDEDKLEPDGAFCDPHFKPDYSPDMFLSINYLSHLGVIKKSLIDDVDGFTLGLEGAQDYDLYLRVTELTDKITHIPKVLYHWRKVPGSTAAAFNAKSYAHEVGAQALRNAVRRRNLGAQVLSGKCPGIYRLRYSVSTKPLISIIIPFRDKPALLATCIEPILERSTYQNFEVVGISNNSEEEGTFTEMKRLQSLDHRICFHEYNKPYNYSEINNHAVNNYTNGEHIVLLNNDTEIITPDWLESMLEYSQRDDVGVVGAKLYYPDNRIQHAGIIIGMHTLAGHSHQYFHREEHGYFSRLRVVQNMSALTAACFMVKRRIYQEVGGLDQVNLKIAFNDVDFCLRVREKKYLNVFTPYCEVYHYESHSRGVDDTYDKQARFGKEVEYMRERHAIILKNGDPYYNRNLTLESEDFSLTPDAAGSLR